MSLIILISAPIIFKAQIPENIFIYLLGVILFIIVSLSIGMVLVYFSKVQRKWEWQRN